MPKKFPIFDVPDPESLQAKFVYNFFTPDERFNQNGDGRINGPNALSKSKINELIEENAFDKQIARYIELSWPQATYYQAADGALVKPEILSTFGDAEVDPAKQIFEEEDFAGQATWWVYSLYDPNSRLRLRQKLQGLSTIKQISFESSDQSKLLAEITGLGDGSLEAAIDADAYKSNKNKFINPLIKPTEQQLIVNVVPKKNLNTLYDQASEFKMNALISNADAKYVLNSADDASPLSNLKSINLVLEAARELQSNLGIDDTVIQATLIEDLDSVQSLPSSKEKGFLSVQPVGYLIEKTEIKRVNNNNTNTTEKIITKIPISNISVTNYIDTQVKYDATYSYVVKNIYRLETLFNVSSPFNDGPVPLSSVVKKIVTDIASKSSPRRTILTREYIAPLPPDGVFYRFNYNRGRGLIITWQYPSGRSRDVKYFQIFKRSAKIGPDGQVIAAIDQPFECIAEIDFNDTDISQNPPPRKPEQVRSDRIIKESYARLFYEDSTFGREDTGMFGSFIYAVCAVDAHGLSSGYSAQSLVTFNRVKNRIEIKNISKPGAPKQYPNFFIDPRMDENITVDSFSQDVILDSGCTSIDVFFTPDARIVASGGKNINVFSVAQSEGDTQNRYKLHAINLDLQKSDIKEIVINDPT